MNTAGSRQARWMSPSAPGPRCLRPSTRIGLIVVDEEHENSYKQDEGLRYHARDVAIMRAKFQNAVAVLGSATPSLESYYNAKAGKYRVPAAREPRGPPAHAGGADRRRESDAARQQLYSPPLLEEIGSRLEKREQIAAAPEPARVLVGPDLPGMRRGRQVPELQRIAYVP